ncbi:uncharacterized protein LOC107265861 isoform X2 [Cephus cinctus]|uniref:Uncharacterized protein LOC107265861 isoform X2 n=3 Tax=Cephus cinctus TaxID=211228 RepID=A0AAJ7RDC2_CEPCN|nr:uncharacterized protein LOC107265861 isoform X2 [Cephus cinctus]
MLSGFCPLIEELLITTLLKLVVCTIHFLPSASKLDESVIKIWNLPVTKDSPKVIVNLMYWIKFLLSGITYIRSYTAKIYCILLFLMLIPILTWHLPFLLVPWMILEVINKFLMQPLVILLGILLCIIKKCSFRNLFEFLMLESVLWILSVRNWFSVKKLYNGLKHCKQILTLREAQKNLDQNYEESILFLDQRRSVTSVLNIHELTSPLPFLKNPKLTESLPTLLTTDSYNSEDIDKASSITSLDIDLSPAQKSMKILGITGEDIMNVKINVNRKVSTASSEVISVGNQITVEKVQCSCTVETCSDDEEKHSENSDKLNKEKMTLRNDSFCQDFFDNDKFPSKWSSEEDLDDQKVLKNFMETYTNMKEQEDCSTFYPADEKLSEETLLKEKQSSFEEVKDTLSNNNIAELLTEPEPAISVALNDDRNNLTECTNLKNIIRQLSNENWAMKIGLRNQLSSRFNEQCLMWTNVFSKKNIQSWLEHPVKCQIEHFNKLPQNGSNSVMKYSKKCNYSQTTWKLESISRQVGTNSNKEKKDMNTNEMVSYSKKQNHQSNVISTKTPKLKNQQEVINETISWGTVTLAQSAHSSGYEKIKSKPPVYPKKDKKSFQNISTEPTINSINRNASRTQDRNKIRKRSKDRDSMRSSKSSRISRISESLEEREAREMKALRAYNEKTLIKDKLEMESKKRDISIKNDSVVIREDLKDPSKFPNKNILKNYDPLRNTYYPKTQDIFIKKLNISDKDALSILEFLDTYNITQLIQELKKIRDLDILEPRESNILEKEKIKRSSSCNNLAKDLQADVLNRITTSENINKNIKTPTFQEVKCKENISISVMNERTSQDQINIQDKGNNVKIIGKSESFKEVIKNINWISFTKNQIETNTCPTENLQDNHWQDQNENEAVKFDDTLHWLMRIIYFTNQDETRTLKSLDYNRKFVDLEIMIKDLKEWNFVGVPSEFVSQPSVEIDLSLDDSAIPCGFKLSQLNIPDEEPCTSAGIPLENSSEIQSHAKPNIEKNCLNVHDNPMDFNDTKKIRNSIYLRQHFFLYESLLKNATFPSKNNLEDIQKSSNAESLSKISSSHSYSLDSKIPSDSSNQTISLGDQSIMEEFSSDSFDRQGTTET